MLIPKLLSTTKIRDTLIRLFTSRFFTPYTMIGKDGLYSLSIGREYSVAVQCAVYIVPARVSELQVVHLG
jgi:hypothetical protein